MSNISRGFSLIELLITIAIIGVLAALAYPAYDNYIMKSRRTEATSTLMEMAQKQEDVRSDTNSYTSNIEDLRMSLADKTYYEFSIITKTGASKSTYTLKAVPKEGSMQQQKDETCAMFFLTQTGQKVAKRKGGNKEDPIDEPDKITTKDCW